MDEFVIFIVIGLYWFFAAMKQSAKRRGQGGGKPTFTESLSERIEEAQRRAEIRVREWEEEQIEQQGGEQEEAVVRGRLESSPNRNLPERAAAQAPARWQPAETRVSRPGSESTTELKRRLSVETARRRAAERDRDEALGWVHRLEEGLGEADTGAHADPSRARAARSLAPVPELRKIRSEGDAPRSRPGIDALHRLTPLRRGILYAEIMGPPVTLRPPTEAPGGFRG